MYMYSYVERKHIRTSCLRTYNDPSIRLSIYLSVYLLVYLSIHPSIYLSMQR